MSGTLTRAQWLRLQATDSQIESVLAQIEDYRKRIAELSDFAIEAVALGIALDNICVYPAAVSGGTKPYEKRTEWMEGWNACLKEIRTYEVAIDTWLDTVPAQHRESVEKLIIQEKLRLIVSDKGAITMCVDCSDTFYWGCADAEKVTYDDLPLLLQCYEISADYGGELYACRKRKMRPQTASYKECYPRSVWHLFDAAGPERDDSDGKGRASLCN